MKKHKDVYDKIFRVVIDLIIINIIILIAITIHDFYIIERDKKSREELEAIIEKVSEQNNNPDNKLKLQLEDLKDRNKNNEIKGWIQVEDTNINYPILQGTDNQYYLDHNYKKQKSKYGSIFLNHRVDLGVNNQNYLIYGHNITDKSMFNNLVKYCSRNFYETHKTIKLFIDNEEKESKYEIISVFRFRISNENEIFKYYNYINLNDKSVYNEYIYNIKRVSLYHIDLSAEYGEQLITLSTCDAFRKDARIVIVAKKVV